MLLLLAPPTSQLYAIASGTENNQAEKEYKLDILTFTELLLHGVSDTVNGGVIFSIQDVGG